jgi:hypothetical protein
LARRPTAYSRRSSFWKAASINPPVRKAAIVSEE